jgi:hypothetical protein
MPQRWDSRGQEQHLEQSWEPAGELPGAITLVVADGDDLAWSAEDLEQRRAGIGAIRVDSENLDGLRKNLDGLRSEVGTS